MIDCSKVENYFAEKRRMTRSTESKFGICKIDCKKCPLCPTNNGTSEKLSCTSFEKFYPEKAISIVQRWSDEHPQKTYLSEFLKHYPHTKLRADGTPESICLQHLGLMSKDDCNQHNNCIDCWKQPIEESESK